MDPLFMYFVQEAEEEERQEQLRLERIALRDQSNPFELPEIEFRRRFRLNKVLVQDLIALLTPHMNVGIRITKIPIQIRVFAALRFFAQGSYQLAVGNEDQISMSQPAFSRVLSEVCSALETVAPQFIKFPVTQAEKDEKKVNFMAEFGFPGVVGCVDGTHIALVEPKEFEHLYFNRKQFHSKNVQLICDANLLILNVNASYGGATHDAFIWRHSNIKEHLQQNFNGGDHNTWLIGDSGYPQEPWLMTPVQGALPETPEGRYNTALSRARNCIERCIGVLKNRFRCLLKQRVLNYDPFKAGQIINAVCVLHNICINANVPVVEDDDPIEEDDIENIPVPHGLLAQNILQEGQQRRADLINMYFQGH